MEEDPLKKVRSYQDNLQLPTNSLLLNYLTDKRGLSIETIELFQLGCDDRGNITIPIFDGSNKHLGFKFRANPFTDSNQKYWHSQGLQNSVFNLNQVKNNELLIITEGEIDCISLYQAGFNAVSQTTGASLQSKTITDLKSEEIIIALDNDETGVKSMYRLAKELSLNSKVRFIELSEVKDWNDLLVKCQSENLNFTETVTTLISSSLTPKEFIRNHYKQFDKGFIQTISVSEVPDEKIQFLADPLFIRNGVNLLTASPKSLKSMLVIELLVACMQGRKFINHFPTTQISKALLIDQESLRPELKARIIKFSGNAHNFLLPVDWINFDVDEDITQRLSELIEIESIDVVVIDTLRRVNQNMDENSSKDVSQFFSRIIPLAKQATIIIIHHETKANGKGYKSNYRGSGDILGAVDSHIYIQSVSKSENQAIIKISHPNARYTGSYEDVQVEFISENNTFQFRFLGELEDDKEKLWEQQLEGLEEFIKSNGEAGRNTEQIEQFCKEDFDGMGQHKSRQLRESLIEDGTIVKFAQFGGSKATHFIHKEFATQQLNTL